LGELDIGKPRNPLRYWKGGSRKHIPIGFSVSGIRPEIHEKIDNCIIHKRRKGWSGNPGKTKVMGREETNRMGLIHGRDQNTVAY